MALGNYLTVIEAAAIVGCTRGRIYQLLEGGNLEGVKFHGRAWAVLKKSAEDYAKRPIGAGRPRSHATS